MEFGCSFVAEDAEPQKRTRRITRMAQLAQTLDRAQTALQRSVRRVRRAPARAEAHAGGLVERGPQRVTRSSSAVDQSVAALQAVVWIASFVQSIFNEIRGRSDEL